MARHDDTEELEPAYVTRARQRRRALTTFAVLFLALFFAFWYAYSYYRDDNERIASRPQQTCTQLSPVRPQDVSVNVYNATKRAGLASKTGKQLAARGFGLEKVGNDPLTKTIRAAAEVRYGPNTATEAKFVAQQVAGSRLAADQGRSDGTIDLVLGNAFKALAPAVPQPTVTCR